ncbi:MAG TPA: preprotein translocase subunit SecG [Candidatus Krumholzibacteria bacterium]|nr:preprotein translocase subunit SecG [Candidatus Krumholzibacteria bacterium]HPD71365.1 preprotein translocase subunit SecG [Candidatus Krumholzibacteria bacterium]HRY38935.1 preprotein translocase subunit SecG [Candidatus Krumholzibacteria bacterium]
MIYVLFVILHVLVSVVLCVAVLLQSSKGGGLAGAFGGTGGAPQQILGSRGMTTLLHKVTIWCGIGFMVTSLALFMMSGSQPGRSTSVLENAQQSGDLNADSPAPPIQDSGASPAQPSGQQPAAGEPQDEGQ